MGSVSQAADQGAGSALGRCLGLLRVLRTRADVDEFTFAALIDATVELEALDVDPIEPDAAQLTVSSWEELLQQAADLVDGVGDTSPADAGVFLREALRCHRTRS